MTDKEEQIISIRENPLYNYSDVVEKICHKKTPYINKLARRKQFQNGIYRLKKQLTERHSKLLNEHIEILGCKKILWIKMSNEEAKQILGTDLPPIFNSYLNDLRRYWGRHEMALYNLPYIFVHDIEYVKRPVQTKLYDS
jgi:hypothetical protein